MKKQICIDGIELIVGGDGRVWNSKGKELKQSISRGYCVVGVGNKVMKVHRIIAFAFLDNPNNLPCINHKDGNKQNNNVSNLEWCTQKHNIHHSLNTGLFGCCRRVLCIETNKSYSTEKECGIDMNIDPSLISRVCNGKQITSGGYHFKFVKN